MIQPYMHPIRAPICHRLLAAVALLTWVTPVGAQRQPFPADLNLTQQAPDSFLVHFETTKGTITIRAVRRWSPLGVDRLYQLSKAGYYNGNVIYRVGPTASYEGGMVVQFGIGNSGALNRSWDGAPIADEPVSHPNGRGTVNFARAGPNSRTVELGINLTANSTLDTVSHEGVTGFPPIAEVVTGWATLEAFNREYGNRIFDQWDSVVALGRTFLDRAYPGLDRIIKVSVEEYPMGGAKVGGDSPTSRF